jgi:hypothetical protein
MSVRVGRRPISAIISGCCFAAMGSVPLTVEGWRDDERDSLSISRVMMLVGGTSILCSGDTTTNRTL